MSSSWEPKTPLEINWFKAKSLKQLLKICHDYWNLNWKEMPFGQKYYCFARQVFIRKCSKTRILPTEAFQFVYCVTKGFNGGTPVEEIVDCKILKLFDYDASWD